MHMLHNEQAVYEKGTKTVKSVILSGGLSMEISHPNDKAR